MAQEQKHHDDNGIAEVRANAIKSGKSIGSIDLQHQIFVLSQHNTSKTKPNDNSTTSVSYWRKDPVIRTPPALPYPVKISRRLSGKSARSVLGRREALLNSKKQQCT